MSPQTAVYKAWKLFRAFQGREPKPGEILDVSASRDTALVVGSLVGVIYQSAGDGKQYIHRFKKDARPVLAVSSDGKQLHALAGAYEFTDRGFEDR